MASTATPEAVRRSKIEVALAAAEDAFAPLEARAQAASKAFADAKVESLIDPHSSARLPALEETFREAVEASEKARDQIRLLRAAVQEARTLEKIAGRNARLNSKAGTTKAISARIAQDADAVRDLLVRGVVLAIVARPGIRQVAEAMPFLLKALGETDKSIIAAAKQRVAGGTP